MASRLAIFLVLSAALGLAGAARATERGDRLVAALLAADGAGETAARRALTSLGHEAVASVLEARKKATEVQRRRLDRALADLAGREESFPLPATLADPRGCKPLPWGAARPAALCVSDRGDRVALSLPQKKGPARVVVWDRARERVVALLPGASPRLSSDGRRLAYLRPRGDEIEFYKTFYTSGAAVFYPDTQTGFVLDPRAKDEELCLTLSADGGRAAYVSRLTCTVRTTSRGGAPLRTVEGRRPALSPDGKWLAFLDHQDRVALTEVEGRRVRVVAAAQPKTEVLELACLSDGRGAVFLLGPQGAQEASWLWGASALSGARGRLAAGRGLAGLAVSDAGRILWRGGGVRCKTGLGGKETRLAARANSAALSPWGWFAAWIQGRKVTVTFLGKPAG